MIALLLGLAQASEPDWTALDQTPWKPVATKPTDVGPVLVRASYVEAVGCVEGRVTVDVPADALLAVTADMVSAPAWSSASLTASEVLETGPGRFVLFQVLDVPAWTLSSDRYWVLEGRPDAAASRYRWTRVEPATYPQLAARVRGAVEPPVNYGEWQFTPSPGGTGLRYRACVDFGGPVPVPVQRWITTQQVPALIEDLVLEAARRP